MNVRHFGVPNWRPACGRLAVPADRCTPDRAQVTCWSCRNTIKFTGTWEWEVPKHRADTSETPVADYTPRHRVQPLNR